MENWNDFVVVCVFPLEGMGWLRMETNRDSLFEGQFFLDLLRYIRTTILPVGPKTGFIYLE